MHSVVFLSSLCFAQANSNTGAFVSVAGSALSRGANTLVPEIVETLKSTVLPGQNETLFWFDPIRFDDFSVGDYGVTVEPDTGVKVKLTDMSNKIAHTQIFARDLLGFVKCYGELWGEGTGASYTAMNALEVDGAGKASLVVTTGDFAVGDIQIHHQMQGAACEGIADALHLIDSAVIDLIGAQLQKNLAGIVADIVSVPINQALGVLESPPALGFGKEKFQLDNSFVSVSYDDNRITHFNKGEFKSTAHPVESELTPPSIAAVGNRDVVFSFTDYVLNTLFESLYAEHIAEDTLVLPFIRTLFDNECPGCSIAIKNTFGQRGEQSLVGGLASVEFQNMKWEIGAVKGTEILPMVDLSVNLELGQEFSLEQTAANAALKSRLSLQNLEQELIVSHIGKIDTSDLTRDIKLLVTEGLEILNAALPPLELPVVAGVKLANEKIIIDNRELRVEADLVAAGATGVIV